MAYFTDGATCRDDAQLLTWSQALGPGIYTHVPHTLFTRAPLQVLFQPPLHGWEWGKTMPQADQAPPNQTAQSGQRLRAGLSAPGPGLARHLTQPRTLSHKPLMRRWWTLLAARPAAHSSFPRSQSPVFVLQQQAQIWWASPGVKPLLAPQPLLQTLF